MLRGATVPIRLLMVLGKKINRRVMQGLNGLERKSKYTKIKSS